MLWLSSASCRTRTVSVPPCGKRDRLLEQKHRMTIGTLGGIVAVQRPARLRVAVDRRSDSPFRLRVVGHGAES